MAGVKGRSGGARPNTGGARPGAGRKPKEPIVRGISDTEDPEIFLTQVMQDKTIDVRERKDAAKALLSYRAKAFADRGKKDSQKAAAEQAAAGRFAPGMGPRLVVNNR